VTSRPSAEGSGAPADDEPLARHALILVAERQARRAQVALANSDHAEATSQGSDLLREIEDLLEGFSSPLERDPSTWSTALRLRDELGGYLLAARTLEETGVSTEVVVNVLRRAATCAEDMLERLAAGVVQRQSA
jgi:hypothetical protein